MANIAVWHIGVNGRRYAPGETLPQMDEKETARLTALGAIRAARDPEEKAQAAKGVSQAGGCPVGEKEPPEPALADDEPDEDEEMPAIDAAEGIVEEEEEAPARKKRARG